MELKKFSISPANEFKLCPRRFYNEYVLGYDVAVKPKHLILGSIYDEALTKFDSDGYDKALEYAYEKLGGRTHDFVDFDFILTHYYVPYSVHNPMPPIENGAQYGFGEKPYDGADWEITGYIDKLSSQEIRGSLEHIIVERKTTTQPIETNSEYWKKLDLDPQIRSYVWAMKKKGFKAGWVCYEVIRKINTTLVSGLDRSLPVEEYAESLEVWFRKHGHKKTIVAHKMFYVSEDMANEFMEEHSMIREQVLKMECCGKAVLEHGYLESRAWYKHENSCKEYGGCPFNDVCKGKITLENERFSRTHKVLK